MQQPPHGYPGGYPQPPYPYGGGGYNPPPPRSGPSVAVIVLIVVVVMLVLGGGGCLVCAVIVAKSADAADAGETETPTSTIGRSPLALQLEGALRKEGIPFDHVECPLTTPRTGAFSCAVLPTENGDPAEVNVTMNATGMAYKLQEGFVVLEGPKLAALLAAQRPGITAPCFRAPKIMKHVGSAFTCDAMANGTVAGLVTTTVLTKTGQVKLDYASR